MSSKTLRSRPIVRLINFASMPVIALSVLTACATTQQSTTNDASVVVKSSPNEPADTVPEGSILPSSLVNYIQLQRYLQPDWSQDDIASPLLALARTEGLNDHERYYLGQLNFMAYEGDAAYEIYSEFAERDDWYGWMSRMRNTVIDARFYANFERLESSINYERENFQFKPEFSNITGYGESALCGHFIEEGEHGRAVDLALKTIARTPRDAPYITFRVISACYDSFKQTGREAELFELAQAVRDDLSLVYQERKAIDDQYPAFDATLFENKNDAGWNHKSSRAPYNFLTNNYKKMIDGLDKFLSCKRDNVAGACSG